MYFQLFCMRTLLFFQVPVFHRHSERFEVNSNQYYPLRQEFVVQKRTLFSVRHCCPFSRKHRFVCSHEFNEEAGAGASPGIAQGGMASAPNMTNGIYGLWSNYSGKRKSKKFKTPMAVRKFLEDNEDWHNKLDEEDN